MRILLVRTLLVRTFLASTLLAAVLTVDAAPQPARRSASTAAAAPLELVESFPIETTLDHPEIPDAHQVWLEMIGGARESLDFSEFYASNREDSRLETVVRAIEEAASRGVRIRFLTEEKFYRNYPETVDRLGAHPGIDVRRYDVGATMGGVLHTKYFVVDRREAFLGSQNFDWRALEHIQELGVRMRVPRLAERLAALFNVDWQLAGGAGRDTVLARVGIGTDPVRVASGADTLAAALVASPRGWLPDPRMWDLPRIQQLVASAGERVDIQLLTYRAVDRQGIFDPRLDNVLRAAAARGVSVRLLLAHWSQRAGTIEGLKSLEVLPNIEVRLLTFPEWSGGFIPFARVAHAKYLVADGKAAWIGTSNWERGYFEESRNVGLVVEGAAFAAELARYFEDTWQSQYAAAVDPCAEYAEPRVAE